MGFYTKYKAVFDNMKVLIAAKDSIEQVFVGEQLKIQDFPVAIINPAQDNISYAAAEKLLENRMTVDVILLAKESEPDNWFESVISPMCDIVDAILADQTITASVSDAWPILFAPGEFRMSGKQ